MLLQEIGEKDKICFYDSSNILSSKYKPDTKQLAVVFKSGRQYVYEGVSSYIYARFKTSNSQGKYLNKVLREYDNWKAEPNLTEEQLEDILNTIKE